MCAPTSVSDQTAGRRLRVAHVLVSCDNVDQVETVMPNLRIPLKVMHTEAQRGLAITARFVTDGRFRSRSTMRHVYW